MKPTWRLLLQLQATSPPQQHQQQKISSAHGQWGSLTRSEKSHTEPRGVGRCDRGGGAAPTPTTKDLFRARPVALVDQIRKMPQRARAIATMRKSGSNAPNAAAISEIE